MFMSRVCKVSLLQKNYKTTGICNCPLLSSRFLYLEVWVIRFKSLPEDGAFHSFSENTDGIFGF